MTPASPTVANVDVQLALSLYQQMVLIRRFEESAIELFAKGMITGSTHPCIGQEAIPVGVCSALEPSDFILATYRGHGAALAKGSDPARLMAELLTRSTGCCRGRGGSMHVCDAQKGVLGTNAIVAGHIPMAGGAALASKLRGTREVTVCFFGDGAACEGETFETLNMAALWKLPLLFVCENNGYAISVTVSQSQSTPDIADRARGFEIPSWIVDGNDPLAVRDAALQALTHMRSGGGPAFLECKTVRWERHSAFSSGKYANPEEAQRWKTVDPIPRLAAALRDAGIGDAELEARTTAATSAVAEAVRFALDSPQPAAESVFDGIFAEGD